MKKIKYSLLAMVLLAGITVNAQDGKKKVIKSKRPVKKEVSSKEVVSTGDKKTEPKKSAESKEEPSKETTKMKAIKKPVKKTATSGK